MMTTPTNDIDRTHHCRATNGNCICTLYVGHRNDHYDSLRDKAWKQVDVKSIFARCTTATAADIEAEKQDAAGNHRLGDALHEHGLMLTAIRIGDLTGAAEHAKARDALIARLSK